MRIVLIVASFLAALPFISTASAAGTEHAASAEGLPSGRLPDAASPQAYRLDLTIDPSQPRFSGIGEIDIMLKAPASQIFLHGRDLAVRKAEARVQGRTIPGIWTQRDPLGLAELTFAEVLPSGSLTLAFNWDAAFGDGPSGIYRIEVDGKWYVWSQFQSIDARAAFPSFDEPGFKTPFSMNLRTPPGLFALSNAPERGITREGGLDVHRFEPTLPLPTYLVAVVAGPFARQEGAVPPTSHRAEPLGLRVVSTQPNAGKLAFALQGSKEIVALLEDYFGDGFPYPKLDQITSPVMPGAMENAGADIYGDPILVMDENAPVSARRRFGMVVAHELAHQWFGDLVTPAWWDDIWLNESFANWMGYRIGHQWRPDLNIGAGALAEGFEAMDIDALGVGRPIRQPILTDAQIDGAFDSITYGKGGHVIAMIAAFMGEERFRDGVRSYMAAHRHGNATSEDFFAAMARAAGNPRILPAMQGFVGQQGVPLITLSGKPGRYVLRQSRYAPLGTAPDKTRWGIPVCLRAGVNRQCLLLDGESAEVDMLAGDAVMPNAGGTGYYRFEVPRKTWKRLIAGADKLSGGEALALADSLEASFRAGRASLGDLAALAQTMIRNPDPYAASAATAPLRRLASDGIVSGKGAVKLRAFMARLHAPLLAQYGFDPRAGAYGAEDPDHRQRRAQLVGQMGGKNGDPNLATQLREAAQAWIDGRREALDPEWYRPAFAAWLDQAGIAGARTLMATALASEDPQFRPAAIAVLGGTGDQATARWLLEEFADPRLRAIERLTLIGQVLDVEATRSYGYGWFRDNFASLSGGTSGIFLATRLPGMVSGYCSVEQAGIIDRDFSARLKGTRAELALARTIEQVRNCGQLKQVRGARASAAARKLR